jgi:hypothetical protein
LRYPKFSRVQLPRTVSAVTFRYTAREQSPVTAPGLVHPSLVTRGFSSRAAEGQGVCVSPSLPGPASQILRPCVRGSCPTLAGNLDKLQKRKDDRLLQRLGLGRRGTRQKPAPTFEGDAREAVQPGPGRRVQGAPAAAARKGAGEGRSLGGGPGGKRKPRQGDALRQLSSPAAAGPCWVALPSTSGRGLAQAPFPPTPAVRSSPSVCLMARAVTRRSD